MAGMKERAQALAEQLDRWIHAVAATLARILGPIPADTVAEAVGASFPLSEGASVTMRSGAGWFLSSDAELMTAMGEPAA